MLLNPPPLLIPVEDVEIFLANDVPPINSITIFVPVVMVDVDEPRAFACPMRKGPALIVVVPAYELLPVSVIVPFPAFTRLPVPLITPAYV